MLIWYYYSAMNNAFRIDSSEVMDNPDLFLRNMRCTECYWMVPGTEG